MLRSSLLLAALSIILSAAPAAFAQPAPETTAPAEPRPIQHESELGIASASGNSESNTYNVKQTTSYKRDMDKATLTARYLNTNAAGTDTAKNWDGALRYDRSLSNWWSLYASFGLESDRFAGFTQRNNHDLGTHYDIIKKEESTLFAEAGYRYTYTMYTTTPEGVDASANILRLYVEGTQKVLERTSFRLWVEYLPNFTTPEDYRVNFEPSFVSQLSGFLSLKVGYLVKYHNVIVPPTVAYSDRLFTTSLVAKF